MSIRQKYLLCKPGHLSAGVDEFFFANESLAQMRMVRKLKPFPQSADVSIISSSLYDDKLNRKLDQVRIVGIHIVTVKIVLLAFFSLERNEFIYLLIFFSFSKLSSLDEKLKIKRFIPCFTLFLQCSPSKTVSYEEQYC